MADIQYCQEITYQKQRPRRGHFASALRPLPPADASMLRPLCVHSASAGTCSCVRPAGALRPVCVSAGVDAVIKYRASLFIYEKWASE